MKQNENNKVTVITVNKDDSDSEYIEVNDENSALKHSPNSSVNNISTQRQLLSLAKQFSLEGGLRSPDKQLPISERVVLHQQNGDIRKQRNLESIIQQALVYSSEDEITDRADVDWFNSFISLAENISNTTMQALWAKILAGEVSRPGSFSLKALKVFRYMSISDAKLLAKAHRIAVKDQTGINMRIITGCYQKPNLLALFFGNKEFQLNLSEFGLNYSDILALADNHLIFSQETETRTLRKSDKLIFNFHNTPLSLAYKNGDVCLKFYKFTTIGNELAQLITDTADKKYFDKLKQGLEALFLIN